MRTFPNSAVGDLDYCVAARERCGVRANLEVESGQVYGREARSASRPGSCSHSTALLRSGREHTELQQACQPVGPEGGWRDCCLVLRARTQPLTFRKCELGSAKRQGRGGRADVRGEVRCVRAQAGVTLAWRHQAGTPATGEAEREALEAESGSRALCAAIWWSASVWLKRWKKFGVVRNGPVPHFRQTPGARIHP